MSENILFVLKKQMYWTIQTEPNDRKSQCNHCRYDRVHRLGSVRFFRYIWLITKDKWNA